MASKLDRGFKADAERTAERLRKELGLSMFDPLPALDLARHMDVLVIQASELDLEPERLSLIQGKTGLRIEWFAATLIGPDGKHRIVHNCGCAPSRQESDLMHELSHVLRGHSHEREESYLGFPMRIYNPKHEEEAACLGATLQLPKPALLLRLKEGWSDEMIGKHYGASMKMVAFRKRQSGAAYIRSRIAAKE